MLYLCSVCVRCIMVLNVSVDFFFCSFHCSIVSQPTQPWHDQVNPDLRQHLVKKL